MLVRRAPAAPRPTVGDYVTHRVHAPGRISVIEHRYGEESYAIVSEDWPWVSYVVPLRELQKAQEPKRAIIRRVVRR